MVLKAIQLTRHVVFGSLLMTTLSSTSTVADAYTPGTFSLKPVNVNFGNLAFGFVREDSLFTNPSSTVNPVKKAAFRRPLDFGFAESDRNGIGYGFEFGYLIGQDWEIFGRAGYCQEQGNSRFSVGNRSFDFKNRSNYGFSAGPRRYFDFQSSWRPFIQAAAGFTVQDATRATINWGNPLFVFSSANDVPIGVYQLAKRSTLFNFEFGAGTDYAFTENVALSFSVAVRYSSRGGGAAIATPGNATSFAFPVPPVTITYKDNKQHWYVPVTVSLKFMF